MSFISPSSTVSPLSPSPPFLPFPPFSAFPYFLNARPLSNSNSSGSCLTLLYNSTTPTGLIVLPLLFIGAGAGCIFQPILVAFQAHVTKAKRAVIIANRNFFRCGGGACGLAVSGAVLQAALRAHLPPEYAYLAESTYAAPPREAGGVVVDNGILEAYVAASRAVFILQIPLIGLCLLGCAFIRDRGLQPLEEDNEDEGVKEGFDSSVDELQQQHQQQETQEKNRLGKPRQWKLWGQPRRIGTGGN